MKLQRKYTMHTEATKVRDPFYSRIAKHIREHGWRLQGVLGDEENFPFFYTIGNHQLGLPELLLIGSYDNADILNWVCDKLRRNARPFRDGELIYGYTKLPLKSLNAGDEAKEQYTVQVGQYYGTENYAVLQIVIPDKSGRYPDDPKCDVPFCWIPLLRKT